MSGRAICRVAVLALAAGPACSFPVRAVGRVVPEGDLMRITTTQGRSRPLRLDGDAAAMRHLDGHLVEIEGRAGGGRIVVEAWRVVEGLHGLSCWRGELQPVPGRDGEVALYDADNGITLRLDPDGARLLSPWVGRPVLIEGYAESGLGLHVVYYRPLFDTDGAPEIE